MGQSLSASAKFIFNAGQLEYECHYHTEARHGALAKPGIFVARSPIKEAITIVKQPVQFSPPGEQGEEIDLVIVMADTVLLVEAKCISMAC